ncbi:MAG TPA: DUF3726 domain-containing protein, partial [Kiloniellales bacterium]
MRCSLNEVERICQKAAEGAHAPAGLDTDASKSAAWLVARGLPALAGLALDLTRFPDLAAACRFEHGRFGDGTLEARDKAGAVIAPLLIDLLVARAALDREPGAFRVSGLTAPLFLLPPAVRYAAEGWHVRLSLTAGAARAALRVAAGGEAVILGSDTDVAGLLENDRRWTLEAACARAPDHPDNGCEPGLGVLRDAKGLAAAAAESLAEGVSPDRAAWDR